MKGKIFFISVVLVFSLLIINLNFVIAEDAGTADSSNAVEGGGESGSTASATTTTETLTTDNSVSESATTAEPETDKTETSEEVKTEEKPEFNVEAGMTPDNPLYFVKDAYQRMAVGDNPERAFDYREQKIAEAQIMVEEGKTEEAGKVLDRALQYGDIVEKEISPELKGEIEERSQAVQYVMEDLKGKVENKDVKEKFDENLQKEKKIETAAELVSKISELCDALANLDLLQYADTCKSKGDSPKWQKEKDKELTKEQEEQSKVFIEKLSQCFENPKECNCKGMGIQKFEEFCLEKSKSAIKCQEGDDNACKELENGADPTELLPDYLISSFKKLESRYMKAEMGMSMPEECVKANVKSPEECNKIMFKLNSPKECIDAGLTGKSMQDEEKCKALMFEKNAPKECIDAGISIGDADASRKCAELMFKQRAPSACIDSGITGERRDDEKRCRELMLGSEGEFGNKPVSEGGDQKYGYKPKFNRDCKAITDSTEKMKCFEEFYNNAQVQFSDEFMQREMTDSNTGEKISAEEEAQRKVCRDKGMNTILEHENGKRIVICVDKNYQGSQGQTQQCQSSTQIENLKQDCKNRGQDANVETRGGCPWVICIGGTMNGEQKYYEGVQQPANGIQQSQQVSGGQKCPDGICDSYERMNPYACPEDCGGQRVIENREPMNRIEQPQQPGSQEGGNFCSGQAPSCAPDGAPFCDNGNWKCPEPQQQQMPPQQQQPLQPSQPIQEPAVQPEPQLSPEPAPSPSPEITPAPVTGGAIAIDGEFWSYWFNK
jgi:hypothetical protein